MNSGKTPLTLGDELRTLVALYAEQGASVDLEDRIAALKGHCMVATSVLEDNIAKDKAALRSGNLNEKAERLRKEQRSENRKLLHYIEGLTHDVDELLIKVSDDRRSAIPDGFDPQIFQGNMIRILANMDIKGLSEASGLSTGVLRKYANGASLPSIDRAYAIAKANDMTLSELVEGESANPVDNINARNLWGALKGVRNVLAHNSEGIELEDVEKALNIYSTVQWMTANNETLSERAIELIASVAIKSQELKENQDALYALPSSAPENLVDTYKTYVGMLEQEVAQLQNDLQTDIMSYEDTSKYEFKGYDDFGKFQ